MVCNAHELPIKLRYNLKTFLMFPNYYKSRID